VTGREGRVIGAIGAIGVNRDITESKKAEAELLLRNQELESLVYIASVLVQGGSFQEKCADALEQLALSVQAELVTLRIYDEDADCFRLISQGGPDDWEQPSFVARDSTTGKAFDGGVPIVVNDYAESPLARAEEIGRGLRSVVCFPIKIGGDQPLGVVNVGSHEKDHFTPERIRLLTAVTDGTGSLLENARLYQQTITELEQRQRAEEALRESEARCRQLYDEAPVGYHEVDAEGRINRVNRTELEMLGYTSDEMLGRRIWEFVVEEETSRQSFNARMAGAIPSGQGYERTFIRKDGSTISALVEDRELLDDRNRIVGIRSTIQDITERKQTEERLTETARLVSVGELAAGVAHEINNPLTVVSGFSELLVNIDLP
jgi:PAS domain S-box-containing protein